LYGGFVDDGQHFLGLRLGGRKEPGAKACGRYDGFSYLHVIPPFMVADKLPTMLYQSTKYLLHVWVRKQCSRVKMFTDKT
jgi:hypothetical protein